MRLTTFLVAFATIAVAESKLPRSYSSFPAIRTGVKLIWRDPGAVEKKDLRYGPGGRALAPKPPFTFLQEEKDGTSPKVLVRDSAGRTWSVKFGREVSADVFASRVAWALGYFADPVYYLPGGTIRRATHLSNYIGGAGRFRHARFELRSKSPQYLANVSWSWTENPFAGTRELNGLKILTMLLSNWDNKDLRDAERGSNLGIYRSGNRYLFFVNDWGSSLGDWGSGPTGIVRYFTRSKWDCGDFSEQSRQFLKVDDDGSLDWAFRGNHIGSMSKNVAPADIRWLMRYLGRLTPQQIRAGLLASGATATEADCFTRALSLRIRQLSTAAPTSLAAASRVRSLR